MKVCELGEISICLEFRPNMTVFSVNYQFTWVNFMNVKAKNLGKYSKDAKAFLKNLATL